MGKNDCATRSPSYREITMSLTLTRPLIILYVCFVLYLLYLSYLLTFFTFLISPEVEVVVSLMT